MKKWSIFLSLCFFPMFLQGCQNQDHSSSVISGVPAYVSKYEYQETITINFQNKVKEEEKITQNNIQELLGDNLQADTFSNVFINPEGLILSSNEYNGVIHFLITNGYFLKELKVPNIDKYAVKVDKPGSIEKEDMRVLGEFIRDIIKENPTNYRLFGPDETMSNRLNKVFEVTNRDWYLTKKDTDEYLSVDGRVMDSYLSEHACEGWLEGYLLTGRHGTFASYEAFIRIIDSMASQHAKWLKVCNELPWRKDIASLNYILTSNVWQQDHNGYTHQDPGFIDHLANKKADIVRVYLPPDSNCLLSCYDHIIKTKNYINVIVASKHMRPQWLTMDEAKEHCAKGLGKWEFASNDKKGTDVVLVSIGDAPTLENIAAVKLLREYLPEVKVRFINVVDLMKLQPNTRHPHGLTGEEYNKLFTKDKPIIFNYHGYPTLIHEFTYERENKNVSVHGYMEEGTITTPFDMRVKNEIDRYHIVIDVIKHLDIHKNKKGIEVIKIMEEKLKYHDEYIKEHGIETEEIRNFRWE